MKPKTLLVLTGLTAALVGAALLTQRGGTAPPAFTPAPLAPGLADRLNDAASITIARGESSLRLERRPGAEGAQAWALASKHGYPARFEPVKELLVALSEARKTEEKTRNPARYADIGVDEPPKGSGTLVTVADASGATLVSLVLGNTMGPAGKEQTAAFVRPAGQEQSFLARVEQGRLSVNTDPLDWIDRQILALDRPRVSSLVITQADGSSVRLSRATRDQAEPTLEGIPAGRELKFPGITGQAAGALSFVSVEDVRPASEIDPAGGAAAVFRTFDGLVLTVTSVPKDGKTWSLFRAEADENLLAGAADRAADEAARRLNDQAAAQAASQDQSAGPVAPAPVDPEALKKAQDEARAAAQADVQRVRDEIQTINRVTAGWAFDLGSWRVENLTARMDFFLREPTPAPPPIEPQAPQGLPPPAAPAGLPPPPG